MGLNIAGGMELAPDVLTGSVTGTATSTASNTSFRLMYGAFNASLTGTWAGATMELQKSFDGGVTFIPATVDALGSAADYTANASVVVNEPEPGVYYRWQCTVALASGTVNWRLAGGQRVT